MLIGVLTGPSDELDFSRFRFPQMDCYLILSDDASKAFITLIFSIEIEKPLKSFLSLNMILPPGATSVSQIEKIQKPTNKTWIDINISIDDKAFNTALLSIDTSSLIDKKNPVIGIQYEVPVSSSSLDLSLHTSTIIGNALYQINPQQQSILIGHAYIWLTYNNKFLKILSTQSASEEILMGSDILNNNSLLSPRNIKMKTQYSQMMWRTTRPSLGSPFHLNAIIRSADENASILTELKDIVFVIEQRVNTLENIMIEIQEDLNKIFEQLS